MERRRLQRTVIRHPAKVDAGGETIHRCVVHNVTGLGICIELDFPAEQLPQNMAFSFDNFRTTHACKLIWREGQFAGVEFVKIEESPMARSVIQGAQFKLPRS